MNQIKVIDEKTVPRNQKKSNSGVNGVMKKAVSNVNPSRSSTSSTTVNRSSSKLWKIAKMEANQKPVATVLKPQKIASKPPSEAKKQVIAVNSAPHLPSNMETKTIKRTPIISSLVRPKIDFTKNRPPSPDNNTDFTPVSAGGSDADIFGKWADKDKKSKLNNMRKQVSEQHNIKKRSMPDKTAISQPQKRHKPNESGPIPSRPSSAPVLGGLSAMRIPKKKKE
jgi:hypothetical protein